MKPTAFTWAWGNQPRQPDPHITRQRMAAMMRAWRGARTNCGQIINSLALLERSNGMKVYHVVHTPTGECCTFSISVN